MKGCRWVERTGDLFKVAFLEEGRVGDRTCVDVGALRKRKRTVAE